MKERYKCELQNFAERDVFRKHCAGFPVVMEGVGQIFVNMFQYQVHLA